MPNTRESGDDIAPWSRYANAVIFEELTEVLDPEPHPAAWNMAMDEALLGGLSGPTLRVYQWARPAVSFGYFGRVAEIEAAWPGRELVRRWTGGGSVPHGEDLTYALLLPVGHPLAAASPLVAYRAIHEAIATWLRELGFTVELAATEARAGGECFTSAVACDVLSAGQKVAGAAQRRTRQGLLHQGSIQHLPGIAAQRAGLARALGRTVVSRQITPDCAVHATTLVQTKYGTSEWLCRW